MIWICMAGRLAPGRPRTRGLFCRLTKKEAWALCWSCRLLDVAKLGKATAEFKNATPFLKGAFTTLKNIVGAPSQRH